MHEITSFVRAAVCEVFSTMISMDESYPENANPPWQVCGVIGSVSFTGKMSGVLYLAFPVTLANKTTDNILGEESSRPSEEVNDVVGEFTNMVTGNLKSKMADRGYNCKLSIPTVIRGQEMTLDSAEGNLALTNRFTASASGEIISTLVFARLETS
jgi:chemotaxis protein CheX